MSSNRFAGTRTLAIRHKALTVDRVVLARKTVADALCRPVLVVLGIGADGKKEIVELCLIVSDSPAEWERFFAYINRRGPTGDGREVICPDRGHCPKRSARRSIA